MNKADLWDAINEYVIACGGKPSEHVYGNTMRQRAVAAVERAANHPTSRALELENRLRDCVTAMETWGSWEDGVPEAGAGEHGSVGNAYDMAKATLGMCETDGKRIAAIVKCADERAELDAIVREYAIESDHCEDRVALAVCRRQAAALIGVAQSRDAALKKVAELESSLDIESRLRSLGVYEVRFNREPMAVDMFAVGEPGLVGGYLVSAPTLVKAIDKLASKRVEAPAQALKILHDERDEQSRVNTWWPAVGEKTTARISAEHMRVCPEARYYWRMDDGSYCENVRAGQDPNDPSRRAIVTFGYSVAEWNDRAFGRFDYPWNEHWQCTRLPDGEPL